MEASLERRHESDFFSAVVNGGLHLSSRLVSERFFSSTEPPQIVTTTATISNALEKK